MAVCEPHWDYQPTAPKRTMSRDTCERCLGTSHRCPRGDLGTGKWEPSHLLPARWGRSAVRAASWTWSERNASIGQDHESALSASWPLHRLTINRRARDARTSRRNALDPEG